VAFSLFTFQSAFPRTLGQKIWQGSSGFWGDGLIYLKFLSSQPWKWWVAVPVLLGFATMLSEKSTLLYLVAFVLVQQLTYLALNVPGYHWYVASLRFVFNLSALYGLGAFLEYGKQVLLRIIPGLSNTARVAPALNPAVAALLLGVSIYVYDRITTSPQMNGGRTEAYRTLSEVINQNVPPGTLAALEVGALAYYSGREILDLTGLTTGRGEFITGANNDLFFKLRPRVVVIHSIASRKEQAILNDIRFASNYKLSGVVESSRYQKMFYFELR